MPRLRKLQIYSAFKLKVLPALGRLESLEELTISGLHSLKRIGPEFFGISEDVINRGSGGGQLIAFPSLIHLELLGMFELEEWVLPFERSDDTLQIMPRLQILDIWSAPKLKALPAVWKLESLEELLISGLDSLKRIGPEFFGILDDDDVIKGTSGSSRSGESVPIIVFPKLKKLKFSWMTEWEEWEMMMPSWREDVSFIMPCLKELILFECEKLKVVPHNIFSYQTVEEDIEGCSELNQRSRRNQIIRRREIGERGDHSDDDDFIATKSLQDGYKQLQIFLLTLWEVGELYGARATALFGQACSGFTVMVKTRSHRQQDTVEGRLAIKVAEVEERYFEHLSLADVFPPWGPLDVARMSPEQMEVEIDRWFWYNIFADEVREITHRRAVLRCISAGDVLIYKELNGQFLFVSLRTTLVKMEKTEEVGMYANGLEQHCNSLLPFRRQRVQEFENGRARRTARRLVEGSRRGVGEADHDTFPINYFVGPRIEGAAGRLELLEELSIRKLDSVKRIGPEFFGISDDIINRGICREKLVAFPRLIKLELGSMEELEEIAGRAQYHWIGFSKMHGPRILGISLKWMHELEDWVLPFERSDTLQIMPGLR
ncbi:hypothetical protein GIB67_027902 [Kingdonia uniflora]|uniref:Uncharacterized protein n=1 Tax=Kingdonia uniflora TaxID=39325 RepID=A0A7J7LGT5_9MAGN|nr:hypothetical protein GIB67_027902 [Kingdonia uniflora]